MTELTMTVPDDLAARLRAYAEGVPDYEAAVALLAEHGFWLRCAEFIAACIEPFDDGLDPPLAWIDWEHATQLEIPCDPSDNVIRHMAADLATR
jgi:hypothetical protein